MNKELIVLIVEKLQNISLLESSNDVLADAFEIFVSRLLKEAGGQFFTPASVVRFMVNYLNPEIDSKIIDPACGHGGFLLECKDLLLSKIKQKYTNQNEIIKTKYTDKMYFFFSGVINSAPKYIPVKTAGAPHIQFKIPNKPYELSMLLPVKIIDKKSYTLPNMVIPKKKIHKPI